MSIIFTDLAEYVEISNSFKRKAFILIAFLISLLDFLIVLVERRWVRSSGALFFLQPHTETGDGNCPVQSG